MYVVQEVRPVWIRGEIQLGDHLDSAALQCQTGQGQQVDARGDFRFTGPVGRYELSPLAKDGKPHEKSRPRQIILSR